MNRDKPLVVRFFCTTTGREPVREWLHSLNRESKKVIGADIKTVQFGWPLGMPLVRKLESNIWEVRSTLPSSIARVLVTIDQGTVVLLHGFIKKSQKTPARDLALARTRLKMLQEKS